MYANVNGSSLIEKQIELEKEANDEAKQRQRDDNEKAHKRGEWADSKLGKTYTTAAATAFIDTVQTFVYETGEEKARSRVRAAKRLQDTGLPSEKISFLFSKALYNCMSLAHKKPVKRVTLCRKIGDLIHDEYRIITFSESSDKRRNLLKKLTTQFDKRSYPREWRKRTILNYFHAEQLEWSAWGDKERIDIGMALLTLFKNATGLVETNVHGLVEASPALMQHFEQSLGRSVMDYMLYKPMVIKPQPWTPETLFRGGYHSELVKRYPIIKGARKRDVKRILDMDWTQVLPAMNAIQETPWRVNRKMLEVMEWVMFERGGDMAGLPPAADIEPPPLPLEYKTNEEVKKAHNHVLFLLHNTNRENVSKRLAVLSAMTLAKKYRNYPAIYFPHNMDSRGRMYPLPAFLNPQGGDYAKGMLEFAHGVAIDTPEQAAWLAIGGANAYGFDKADLQDRVKWVEDHHGMIMEIANSPLTDLRWTEAGEPFQFLRFCLEWAEFEEYGYGYESRFVVHVDATCSGIQHYSAMLRDEVGGRSVNLLPDLPRQDIYGDVAKRVIDRINTSVDEEHAKVHGNLLAFGVNRSTTKRQVMVVPYAGTFNSCMKYTDEAIADYHKEGNARIWPAEEDQEHVKRLSRLIWDAIKDTVVKAKEAMKWLTSVARQYSKWANENLPEGYERRMTWKTPDGFEVVHWRPEEVKQRMSTYLDGRVDLVFYKQGDDLSPSQMATAIAPNYIHSNDACHMRMALVAGNRLGIDHYAVIHDSFGTHAANMDVMLNKAIKPTFIAMYRGNLLQDFADSLPLEVQMGMDPVPLQGSLDIEAIARSQFVFS